LRIILIKVKERLSRLRKEPSDCPQSATEAAVDGERLVRRFYAELWDQDRPEVAQEILAPDFRFRGSLGAERRGISGFLDYHRAVLDALGDYRSDIKALVLAPGKLAARMEFSGVHRDTFFGMPASGRRVAWAGAAFFEHETGRIARLWVLGDIDAVKRQLGAKADFE
jgi:steroid delta-isomerase-like uncharacterized protein